MVVALSNLILLIPVACVLAIMLSMTGSMVVRPRNDAIRTFVLIVIWQFALLGVIGLLARSSLFSLAWVLVCLVFLIQLWFWERKVARNILLLVFGSNATSESQLTKLLHYLNHEGRGYWQRLGKRFGHIWRTTGSWQLAMIHSRMARGLRVRLALATLAQGQDTLRFNQQIARTVDESKQLSHWLGRIALASLSIFILLFSGLVYEFAIQPTFEAMKKESLVSTDELHGYWDAIVKYKLYIAIPVLTWSLIASLYLIKTFPVLARHRPLAWLCKNYYRALAMESLADGLMFYRDPAQACQELASAFPVPSWSAKLKRSARRLAEGATIPVALTNGGLIRQSEAAALSICDGPEALSWSLRQLSQNQLERTVSRTHMLAQLVMVFLTLLSGVLVCMYALATFGWLAGMIEAVT